MPECTICKQSKQEGEFCIDKRRKGGRTSHCRKCHGVMVKRWSANNRDSLREYGKIYEEKNKEKRKGQHRVKYLENKEVILEKHKIWRQNNPKKARELARVSSSKARSTPKGRLNCCMSANLRIALKGNKAGRHWEELVRYTVAQLKQHLEKKFTSEMNWDNYGTYWEIDHKVPIAAFNFERPDDIDFRLCWSLKNLQPLEKTKNRQKNAKVENYFQPSFALGMGG